MADINGVVLTAGSSPTVKYTITYTKSRPSNSQMKYNFNISCALGSSGSYILSGYALLCTITVNGTSAQVRIKANDGDNWEGTTPRVKTVSVTCASTTANAAQAVRFQVVSDGRLTLSSGVINNSSYTVTSSALLYTACGAPTMCMVAPTVAEGNVTLTWNGASGGTNNAISSYEIQYSESTNNSTWGAWTALTTVNTSAGNGSVSVAPSSTRGSYRRFQVRTRGAAGASYYSGWKVSTNSVRKNTAPVMPSSVTASPATYSNEAITLSWSGASGGTSPIKGYQIASRTSTDNATWSSWSVLTTLTLAASSGTYSPTVSRIPGTYTQFGVWTIDALNVYSGEKISGSIYCNITAAGAPTSCSLNATLAEGNVTLSWTGATGGAGNAISAYEIQYSESVDGIIWGEWIALSTVNSTATNGNTSVAPSSTRGNYRRFQVRTCGSAGSAYYSGWIISSNYVRKNILATPPQTFTANPAVYIGNQVTVAWSGVSPGTSAIKQYVIQESVSGDNQSSWSSWETVATVNSSETSGSAAINASTVPRTYTRYRIAVTDDLGGMTAYVLSNTVLKNSPPLAPFVEAPKAGSVTYNPKPMYLIQTRPEPDGTAQTIWVHSVSGEWYNSEDHPDCFTTPGASAESIKTIFFEPNAVEPGNYSVTIQCRDGYSTGASVNRSFAIAPSPFEDITTNETHVKAAHIQALRSAANDLRNYYHLPAYVWASEIIPGRTQVRDWPFHILELRAAVQGIIDKIHSFDRAFEENEVAPVDWIDIGTGRPRADVMNQLMGLILQL